MTSLLVALVVFAYLVIGTCLGVYANVDLDEDRRMGAIALILISLIWPLLVVLAAVYVISKPGKGRRR